MEEVQEQFTELPTTFLRCIAIDDESLALDLVEDNIAKVTTKYFCFFTHTFIYIINHDIQKNAFFS